MRALPEGQITLVFTDIESSTEWVKLLGARYADVQDQHRRLLRAAFQVRGGVEVDTQGDAFFYVFESALDALLASIDGQLSLAGHAWPEEFGRLKVRMAMHTGQPTRTDEGYIGLDVNRAARLAGAGHGDQILLSASTASAINLDLGDASDRKPLSDMHPDVHPDMPSDLDMDSVSDQNQNLAGLEHPQAGAIKLLDLGEHWLKDLAQPMHAFRIQCPDMIDDPRPIKSQSRQELGTRLHIDDAQSGQRSVADVLLALRGALEDDVTSDELRLSTDELRGLIRHSPVDLDEYRLVRIAEWSQPRFGLDSRFVSLTLMLDQGEDAQQGRWEAQAEQHRDLRELLSATDDPVLVVLGPPGTGKSTLLRQLDLVTCADAFGLRDETHAENSRLVSESAPKGSDDVQDLVKDNGSEIQDGEGGYESRLPVSFFVPLNAYRDLAQAPRDWLNERWRLRGEHLPALDELLAEGRMLLLLDALNEMPAVDERERRKMVLAWREFLQEIVRENPANRAVISCRSLDYSAPLSTPGLRVPQVQIEPMDDGQVQRFLGLHCPGIAGKVWQQLAGTPTLEILRAPYFLKLLVDQIVLSGEVPRGRAGLFTGFVRQAIAREVERENPLFEPGVLLHKRDHRRLVQAKKWRRIYELPDRGALIPQLETLAFDMQAQGESGQAGMQVRIDYDEALDLLDEDLGEEIINAGAALSVLDEDLERDEILFYHQLLQEYFAARRYARDEQPERLALPWRETEIQPSLRQALDQSAPADPMPTLPTSGWEETLMMAVSLSADPASFLERLASHNLALAGQCAAQYQLLRDSRPDHDPEEAAEIAPQIDSLRAALLIRCQHPQADVRARIAAARALGRLGDPRWKRVEGPMGVFLEPPMQRVPAGQYRIGSEEEPARPDESPVHILNLEAFEIASYAVTNAEWRCFMEAGGYEEDHFWAGEDAKAWRRGEGVVEGQKQNWRAWRIRFMRDPSKLEAMEERGAISTDAAADWRHCTQLDDEAFEILLRTRFPDRRQHMPRSWLKADFNHPSQPVVGVSFYEAQAFCAWLSAQSGIRYSLPSEAQWSAAARGAGSRSYAWGNEFDALKGNFGPTRLRVPMPVGVFPDGRSEFGLWDMSGNCFEWTVSLYGREDGVPDFQYPYDAEDGRENHLAEGSFLRVARGGSYFDGPDTARASYRYPVHPALQHPGLGLRLVRPPLPPPQRSFCQWIILRFCKISSGPRTGLFGIKRRGSATLKVSFSHLSEGIVLTGFWAIFWSPAIGFWAIWIVSRPSIRSWPRAMPGARIPSSMQRMLSIWMSCSGSSNNRRNRS